jgi:four helix bundle protein
MVKSYKDLEVWQKSVALVTEIYALTKKFPDDEKFGLTNQVRRAAVSVPSNISEGSERKSTQDFIRYINIAAGSLAEVQTQLIIAENLGYIKLNSEINEKIQHVQAMLGALRKALQNKEEKR